jgi:hypothetical protein
VQALVVGCALASLLGMEMSNIPSKNALKLHKKSILYSILCTQNTPCPCNKPLSVPCTKKKEEQINVVLFVA